MVVRFVVVMSLIPVLSGVFFLTIVFLSYKKVCQEIKSLLLSHEWLESLNLLSKITWRIYFESQLRGQTGKALERPFGTPLHFYSWNQILLQPFNQLGINGQKRPIKSCEKVDTSVVLGPRAQKPLHVKYPLLIGGMSYGGALSLRAKTALAKAATMFGTAANTGSGPFLKEEREEAQKLIFQYSRGYWDKSGTVLSQIDMIEISLGHGAWSSAPVRIKGQKVKGRYARELNTIEGLDILIESRLTQIDSPGDWKALVVFLKEVTQGVPIAVKIGATHHLEEELKLIVAGDIDIVVLDGTEGGSHSVPPILSDDVGMPTLPALCRAVHFLSKHELKDKISLIIGGGLYTPGDFLKCLALGADAVIIGTIASLAMSHTQIVKSVPWEPPTGLIYYHGKAASQFNPDLGAKHLYQYLKSCMEEMEQAVRIMGKGSFREITKKDLVAMDPIYAEIAGINMVSDANYGLEPKNEEEKNK
jgi:glutamate synthase domain-containing protein 2